MSRRGDVYRLTRRLGFGPPREAERVVVIQVSALNDALRTTVIVPLDAHPELFGRRLTVRVPAAEAGASVDHVAVATHVRTIAADDLAAGRVGRLLPRTLSELDHVLRRVLGL
jgi:mRNA-degrading endonuclease toxin of MazEF toxin-antitoxin module